VQQPSLADRSEELPADQGSIQDKDTDLLASATIPAAV